MIPGAVCAARQTPMLSVRAVQTAAEKWPVSQPPAWTRQGSEEAE